MRVLIAEDDPTSRRMLEAILERWGYEVVAVSDGNEAWRVFQGEDPPQLAILDWMMPGTDGIEACRKIREAKVPSPPYIIILTGKTRKEDTVRGLEAGANDYITKPFDPDELRARIRVGRRVLELEGDLSDRVGELEDALDHVKNLQGLLPICMHCHKIRNDEDAWQQLEEYIAKHSDAQFTHSLCPDCQEKHYSSEAMKEVTERDHDPS